MDAPPQAHASNGGSKPRVLAVQFDEVSDAIRQFFLWNLNEAAAPGVALLAWPIEADQFTNAWLLAEAGVAVPVAEGAETVPDVGQVANAITAAMADGEGGAAREGACGGAREEGGGGGGAGRELAQGLPGLEELVHMLGAQ
ncbi:hypothetical protein ACP4OV_000214 [Aristida adscensionis]